MSELNIKDSVARRYGWKDYNHFEINEDSCQNWSFRAVKDIIELEQKNERLKEALTKIQNITTNNFDHDLHRIFKLAKEALENE